MHMAASKKATPDHYEDVLKQILSEVAESCVKKLKLMQISACKNIKTTIFPVMAVLRQILNVQLTNQRSVWEMQADGQYIQLRPKDKQFGVQETLIKLANDRFDVAKTRKSYKKSNKKLGTNRNTG